MPSGKFGSVDLAAGADTLLCAAVPAGKTRTVNVRFANRSAVDVSIRLAIGVGAAPALEDYLSYDIRLRANGIVEDTGIVVSEGEKVWVRCNTANVSARAHGLES